MLFFMVISSIFLMLIPMTVPNVGMFGAVEIIGGMCMGPVMSTPLLLDYVEVESRGRAIGFATMGGALGGFLS